MPDFITITEDAERITSKMPAAETVVEVKLRDGTITRAWFDSNIMENGDWDFVPVKPDGEPDIENDSMADKVLAWRPLSE